ncbi:MAG: tRNA preQ1(34) S-adenosylmethionine ribosyltransferase-isomerase QueA [Oscillospiraceae bacterium]|nr:tRNA preQ1(34) S-adenosylmethionine ribosyltransferase-isomerase QueA [Oscillospiraceae bacterium]
MNTKDFSYYLPEQLIAQTPIRPRDHSRLMCLDKTTGLLQHKHFYDLIDVLDNNCLLVVNNSKVMPARLIGVTGKDNSAAEILLLKPIDEDSYESIVRPGKKLRVAATVKISEQLQATITDVLPDGNRIVKFEYNKDNRLIELLEQYGSMPLPPYIHETIEQNDDYQTVYAKHLGSAAAPTAGFHFTPELIVKLKAKEVEFCEVTLHIGLATFRPVRVESIEQHHIHSEEYSISDNAADMINRAKAEGKRIIAVGTTSARTLEAAYMGSSVSSGYASTDIFIYPGYEFKVIDGLITNFHLPESTLIMLVSALAGYTNTMNAYAEAVKLSYRFYSFGDAMYIS